MENGIPVQSALYADRGEYAYTDSFSVPLHRADVASSELLPAFFGAVPAWFEILAGIRDRIASVAGLKTRRRYSGAQSYRVGQRAGYFRILQITDDEVILGDEDVHLDFRTSLLVIRGACQPVLIVSTLVQTKNRLGRAYFSVVKHVHRFIVPVMVRRMAKRLNAGSAQAFCYNDDPEGND